VALIEAPDASAELWHGTYGNAKVRKGPAVVVTSDGKRHYP
jgi:hypothetical protein